MNGKVDLKDAARCLKILSGIAGPSEINPDRDMNSDGKIGFEDLFFILKKFEG